MQLEVIRQPIQEQYLPINQEDFSTKAERYLKQNYKELFLLDPEETKTLKAKQIQLMESSQLLFKFIDSGLTFDYKTIDVILKKYTEPNPINEVTKSFSSNHFRLVWNSKTFEIGINRKPQKGDYSCEYKLNVLNKICTHKEIIFNPKFSICLDSKFSTKKWKSSKWKNTSKDASMKHLVYHTLNFELSKYISETAKNNLQFFAKFDSFKNIPDNTTPEKFSCDNLGKVIIDQKSEQYFTLCRVLERPYNADTDITFSYLKWEANDLPRLILNDVSVNKCTVTQLIKYSVISMSVDMLFKKLKKEGKPQTI